MHFLPLSSVCESWHALGQLRLPEDLLTSLLGKFFGKRPVPIAETWESIFWLLFWVLCLGNNVFTSVFYFWALPSSAPFSCSNCIYHTVQVLFWAVILVSTYHMGPYFVVSHQSQSIIFCQNAIHLDSGLYFPESVLHSAWAQPMAQHVMHGRVYWMLIFSWPELKSTELKIYDEIFASATARNTPCAGRKIER